MHHIADHTPEGAIDIARTGAIQTRAGLADILLRLHACALLQPAGHGTGVE